MAHSDLAAGKPELSIEVFPPRSAEAQSRMREAIVALTQIDLAYISVTYGAGGTTQERTFDTVSWVQNETPVAPAAHLTCVGATRAETDAITRHYWRSGVRHVVALRGDPPGGLDETYRSHPKGYASTAALVAGIRQIGDFEVSVSAYPEKHPQSQSWDIDLDILAAKADAGAGRAITQFFFDNRFFLNYLEKVRARAIALPIVPGIMPIGNFAQLRNFAARCGTTIPDPIARRFERLESPQDQAKLAVEIGTAQVNGLIEAGINQFHFYPLNREKLTLAIARNLGLAPSAAAA
ncbi:MAG: methylenetetrahydrofolate reductase [Alphaproteobacteria bacterium]